MKIMFEVIWALLLMFFFFPQISLLIAYLYNLTDGLYFLFVLLLFLTEIFRYIVSRRNGKSQDINGTWVF